MLANMMRNRNPAEDLYGIEMSNEMELTVRRIIILAIISCLCISGCGKTDIRDHSESQELLLEEMKTFQFENPENENLADMLQQNGSGMMVQIGAGNQLGSGVIYDIEEGAMRILTAAHVLEEAEGSVSVCFSDGFRVVCDRFSCFEFADAGIIRLDASMIPEENLSRYRKVCVDKERLDAVKPGDGCIVMGSRTGVAAEAYEGTVLDSWIYMEDYEQYMMWVRAEAKPGMSGGGLFDSEGYFLGILSGENEDGELAVVPLSLILAEPD